jgi:hypothetical protein
MIGEAEDVVVLGDDRHHPLDVAGGVVQRDEELAGAKRWSGRPEDGGGLIRVVAQLVDRGRGDLHDRRGSVMAADPMGTARRPRRPCRTPYGFGTFDPAVNAGRARTICRYGSHRR